MVHSICNSTNALAWQNTFDTVNLLFNIFACTIAFLAGNPAGQPSLVVTGINPLNAELEIEINKQINKELFVHYTFLSMVCYIAHK